MSITAGNLVNPFFEEADFIDTASFYFITHNVTFSIIFDCENSVTPIGGVAIENTDPQAICKTSDIIALNITNKSSIVIGGVTYFVKEIQPTANGLTTLILSKVDI